MENKNVIFFALFSIFRTFARDLNVVHSKKNTQLLPSVLTIGQRK